MAEETPNKENEFNEESFRMKRIHQLQETINVNRYKFFHQVTDESGITNFAFQIIFSCIDGLYFETSNLLTDEEIEIIEGKRNLCLNCMSNFIASYQRPENIKAPLGNALGQAMHQYELLVRRMHLKHGLSGKLKKDASKSIINL